MASKDAQLDEGRTPNDKGSEVPGIRRLRVAELFGNAKEIILEHDGQTYRLRITASRKLILTK